MDVGAERIARTAAATLRLLANLRSALDAPIPLAWTPGNLTDTSAIEVYPAATLKVRGLPSSGYKRDSETAAATRAGLVAFLHEAVAFDDEDNRRMLDNDDALDAALCCLSGLDFLDDNVIRPLDLDLAQAEGWIWVKDPER